MRIGMRWAAASATGFAIHFVAVWIALRQYPSIPPTWLQLALRVTHIALLAIAASTCIRLDASARDLPNPPMPRRSGRRETLEGIEEKIPGASLPMLALMLPLVLSVRHHSVLLAAIDLVLAIATAAACARLTFIVGAFKRMLNACCTNRQARDVVWRKSIPRKRVIFAFGGWLAATAFWAAAWLPSTGFTVAYLDSVSTAALLLASLAWLIAFIDANRNLRGWLRA
jgi:hypothetical protein